MKNLKESYPGLFADAERKGKDRLATIQYSVINIAMGLLFLFFSIFFSRTVFDALLYLVIYAFFSSIFSFLLSKFLPIGKISKKTIRIACQRSFYTIECFKQQIDRYRWSIVHKEELIKETTQRLEGLKTPEIQKLVIDAETEDCKEYIKSLKEEMEQDESMAKYKEALVSFLNELYKK